jgi:hypothetical protein
MSDGLGRALIVRMIGYQNTPTVWGAVYECPQLDGIATYEIHWSSRRPDGGITQSVEQWGNTRPRIDAPVADEGERE